MGGNKGKGQTTSNMNCFHCGESGHWVQTCCLKEVPCTRGCPRIMKLLWSSQERSKNCRFLKCPDPSCRAFNWVDEPNFYKNNGNWQEACSSAAKPSAEVIADTNATSSNNIRVTVEEKGKKFTFEGEVDAVVDAMKKNFSI